MEINELRKEIDDVDNQILKLLEKRFQVCGEIGKYKKEQGLQIEDLEREKQIIEEKKGKTHLSGEFVEQFFQLIFKESKKIQN